MRWSVVVRVAVLVTAVATSARAQGGGAPPRGWTVGLGGTATWWTDTEAAFDAAYGPAVQLSYVRPRGLGVDVRAAYVLPTGFYGLTGISGILGLTYGMPAGRHLVQLKAGASGLAGGDSDGSIIAGGGPYGGLGLVVRLSGRLGIQGDVLARYYHTGDGGVFAPSAALGVVLLPRATAVRNVQGET